MSQPTPASAVKRGAYLDLDIDKFADKDKAIAHVDGLVVFVRGAVPGDRVRAKVYKRKKSYAEAQTTEVLRASDKRTEPRCFYFGTCGGCTRQHTAYEAQLAAKRESVRGTLVHHGGFEGLEVPPVLGAEKTYYYRNKMGFNFSAKRWLTPDEIATGKNLDTDFALGLHPPGQPFKVLDLYECYLQSGLSRRLVNAARDFVKEKGWQPWDIKKHTGFLRHLIIRTGERAPKALHHKGTTSLAVGSPRSASGHTGEVMVNLVTNGRDAARLEAFGAFLQEKFPEVTTLVNTVNTGVAQTEYGEATHVVFGPGVIRDRVGPYVFEIAPHAFFQTNTAQAERLYEVARDFAELKKDDLLYDLYCGTGTISLFMAERAGRVVGAELVEEAVENARANAAANGVENCAFVAGDLLELLSPAFVEAHGRPDVLVVDPPRAGMHKKVAQQIAEIRPERFVYVSCNPQTQARDLKRLDGAYQIEAVQPVDLFPQTHHVENVVKLRAKK